MAPGQLVPKGISMTTSKRNTRTRLAAAAIGGGLALAVLGAGIATPPAQADAWDTSTDDFVPPPPPTPPRFIDANDPIWGR